MVWRLVAVKQGKTSNHKLYLQCEGDINGSEKWACRAASSVVVKFTKKRVVGAKATRPSVNRIPVDRRVYHEKTNCREIDIYEVI